MTGNYMSIEKYPLLTCYICSADRALKTNIICYTVVTEGVTTGHKAYIYRVIKADRT